MHDDPLTHQYDEDHWFPFIEDKNGNITGPKHQDKQKFADSVNEYDRLLNGDDEIYSLSADNVSHSWAYFDPEDAERIVPCSPDAYGAFPITCIWGVR